SGGAAAAIRHPPHAQGLPAHGIVSPAVRQPPTATPPVVPSPCNPSHTAQAARLPAQIRSAASMCTCCALVWLYGCMTVLLCCCGACSYRLRAGTPSPPNWVLASGRAPSLHDLLTQYTPVVPE
ncbi:hypothetical protein HaLaN_14702, partial [Haematococcus lacustris]